MPNKRRTIESLVNKKLTHGRRGKGTAESFSQQKLRQAPQKEGGEVLCDLPPVLPQDGTSTRNLTSRINGMTTHIHTLAEKIYFHFSTKLTDTWYTVSSNRCRKQSTMFTTSTTVVVMVSLYCTIKSDSTFSVRTEVPTAFDPDHFTAVTRHRMNWRSFPGYRRSTTGNIS